MITNKRYQTLLMLASTGKPLNKDATEEEKKFYEEKIFAEKKFCLQKNST